MVYNEPLATRVRLHMDKMPGTIEKKVFGGVGFMLQGNLACGVHKEQLIVRVGPEGYEAALEMPFTRAFDLTGRAMKGWVFVDSEGVESEADLKDWIERGVNFAKSLPPK